MKTYNFKKAKELIEKSENLISASLGMHEDWFWTADTIWENGEYKRILSDNADEIYLKYNEERRVAVSSLPVMERYEDILIGGIYGSDWATPTLELRYKDEGSKMIPCFNGDSERGKPISFQLGVLSGPAQNHLPDLSDENL